MQMCVYFSVCNQGFAFTPEGCKLVSDIIKARLGLAECAVLMGANVAKEVALEQFCEATIGQQCTCFPRYFACVYVCVCVCVCLYP